MSKNSFIDCRGGEVALAGGVIGTNCRNVDLKPEACKFSFLTHHPIVLITLGRRQSLAIEDECILLLEPALGNYLTHVDLSSGVNVGFYPYA